MKSYSTVVKSEMGGITVIQVQTNDLNPLTAQVLLASPTRALAPAASSDAQTLPANKPRRTGSLALFFRKVRMRSINSVSQLDHIHLWMF